MENFGFFCKSYSDDFERLSVLVNSFIKYNSDKLFLYISVPEGDLNLAKKWNSDYIIVVSDESYADKYLVTEGFNGLTPGYVNQELCKLLFFKSRALQNYFCLDSDSYFISDFYLDDFMFNKTTPFTVLVQDKDMCIDPFYYKKFWLGRQQSIQRIFDFVELADKRLRTCHGHQIMSSLVLKDMEERLVLAKQIEWVDLIKLSPHEFTWYNAWFQKCGILDEKAIEPIFKTIHTYKEYVILQISNIKLNDIKRSYKGIVLNSKWKPRTPLYYKMPQRFILFRLILWIRFYIYNELRDDTRNIFNKILKL